MTFYEFIKPLLKWIFLGIAIAALFMFWAYHCFSRTAFLVSLGITSLSFFISVVLVLVAIIKPVIKKIHKE